VRRPNRRIGRTTARVVTLAVLASCGLAFALGVGLPDPGAAERAFAGLIGALGCVLAMQWLRSNAEGASPKGRFSVADDRPDAVAPQPPAVEAARTLARALRLGASTIGSYNLLVRPRLQALAAAKLGRAGYRLDESAGARELLGEGWILVDPGAPPPADRMAPGVQLHRVVQLVEILERLP